MKKSKQIRIVFLTVAIFVIIASNCYSISISTWAKPAYDKIISSNLMSPSLVGDEDYTQDINREEFTELIMSYLMHIRNYKLNSEKSPFKDTKNPFIVTAATLNIVSGTGGENFEPKREITREEAALIVYKAERLVTDITKGSIDKYVDRHFISQWAREAVGALTKKEIFIGDGNDKFNPKKNITKEEAFAVVSKLLKNNSKIESEVRVFKDGDEYLSKEEYEFIFKTMPKNRFNIEEMIRSINNTSQEDRNDHYQRLQKTYFSTTNTIKTSPMLFFKYDRHYYFTGIEVKANGKEQRTICYGFSIREKSDTLAIDEKITGSWYNI